MKLIFCSPTNDHIYPGYDAVLKMAALNSGCDALALQSDGNGRNENHFLDLLKLRPAKGRLDIMAIRRNLIILDQAERHNWEPPFVMLDWDMMVFRNLAEAFESYCGLKYDMATSVYQNDCTMPAQLVTSLEPLREFARLAINHCITLPENDYLTDFHDMRVWRDVMFSKKFSVGNTLRDLEVIFDSGMHQVGAPDLPMDFENDGTGYKKLRWKDGLPYCRTIDGVDMPFAWIHMWGKYKSKYPELVSNFKKQLTT